MSELGSAMGEVYTDLFIDNPEAKEIRAQTLYHSLLADLGNDRHFECHDGVLRVGHRRWGSKRKEDKQ